MDILNGTTTAPYPIGITFVVICSLPDPDVTYRFKTGKKNSGYIGNFVETVGDDGVSLITDFDLQQNIFSDVNFAKDRIMKHTKEDGELTVIADGAYGGKDTLNLASNHGVNLVVTALTGKLPDTVLSGFELNDDSTEVIQCPAGHAPERCTYLVNTNSIRTIIGRHCCENCPNKEHCGTLAQKNGYAVSISSKKIMRAKYLKSLTTDEYKQLTRKRNAIEGIPSVLSRRYRVDSSPFFGVIKTGWIYTLAIGAYNFNKFLIHLPRVWKYRPNRP